MPQDPIGNQCVVNVTDEGGLTVQVCQDVMHDAA